MDNQYTSYYLYKKYQAIGGELIDLGIASIDADGTMPTVIKNEYDPACGYVPPTPECKCSAYTYSFTSATVSSAATSITLSYTGCTKPDLTSAATYNWIVVGNHTYNTGTSEGYIIANVSANTSTSRSGTLSLSLDGSLCQNIYISQQSGAAPAFEGKYKLTLNDSSVVSAECDSTSAITSNEVSRQYSETVVSAEIGGCVTTIDTNAFLNCTVLTSVTINNGVTTIGTNAFLGCITLSSVNIANSVTSIGFRAFRDCSGLTTVVMPDSVTTIDTGAFECCYRLTSVTISNNTTTIGDSAFDLCTGLTSVNIPDSVTNIDQWAFFRCYSLTSVTIGSGVTSIDERVFGSCSVLTAVTIPSGVTSIGDIAFYNCKSLTSVTVLATTPPTLGSEAFDYTPIASGTGTIYVPSGSVNTYKSTNGWSDYANRIQAIP